MLTSYSSTRFIVFDKRAKIITEHQTEFQQILPHAGWHEQDPFDLVGAMKECMSKVVENLEWMGWSKDSIKGIGKSPYPTLITLRSDLTG
jgi:glycerol kinase